MCVTHDTTAKRSPFSSLFLDFDVVYKSATVSPSLEYIKTSLLFLSFFATEIAQVIQLFLLWRQKSLFLILPEYSVSSAGRVKTQYMSHTSQYSCTQLTFWRILLRLDTGQSYPKFSGPFCLNWGNNMIALVPGNQPWGISLTRLHGSAENW